MKIVLIALYDLYSHGIRGLHSFLGEKGYDVHSLYFHHSTYDHVPYTKEQLRGFVSHLKTYRPDYVGIGVKSPLFPLFAELAEMIMDELPGAIIISGGPHSTADPESCLEYADFAVVGEGENALVEILDGRCERGIVYGDRVDDLDSLSFPHYGENTAAFCLDVPEKNRASVYTTKGCHFASCSFCQESILGNKPRRKSVRRFKEEYDRLLQLFPKTKRISFADSVFLYDKAWLEEFAETFHDSGMGFWCAGNAAMIDEEMLQIAKRGGIRNVRIGVQSGSKELRENIYNRKDRLDDILRVAELLHKNRVYGNYDFIIESPYDTPETLKETRDFIRRLPELSTINKFELRYWPGTNLTKRALSDGYITEQDVEGNFLRFGDWAYVYELRGLNA